MNAKPDQKLTAVLVDDEVHCTETLTWMLEQYCPNVTVSGQFNDPAQALKYLQDNEVDIIFLDIEMPILNAFDLLRALGETSSDVIFTTAYDEFAIKAIKHNALDYLLKPIDKDELINAVSKAHVTEVRAGVEERLSNLLGQLDGSNGKERFAITTREGIELVAVSDILYAKADDNYTEVYFTEKKRKVISKTLKDVESDLPSGRFIRVHQSYLVSVEKIAKYVRGSGGYVVLTNGEQLPVSRSKKEDLLKLLGVH